MVWLSVRCALVISYWLCIRTVTGTVPVNTVSYGKYGKFVRAARQPNKRMMLRT
jgi:hypothetical protein